jgi:hypothetical protein
MPEPDEPTALYRYFDADDALLYIGISNDPAFRGKAHLYESRRDDWPQRAVRRVDEWHDSRPLALKAEEVAIKAERPLYNGTHNYDDADFDPSSWPRITDSPKAPFIANLMRGEIASGRWPIGIRIPALRTLAESVGVRSVQPVGQAVATLKSEALLRFEAGRGLFVSAVPTPATPAPTPPKPWAGPKIPHDWYYIQGFPG